MATQAGVIQKIQDNFFTAYPAERPYEDILGTSYLIGATTVTVPDGTQWSRGDILENWDTGELMLVTGVATNVLTVARAVQGTTAVAGTVGDSLRKNPRVTKQRIENAIDEIIKDLSTHGVYQIDTTSLTLDQTEHIYSLDLGDLVEPPGVISVYYVDPSTSVPIPLPFQTLQDIHTSALAAGEGIRIPPGTWDSVVPTAYVTKAVAYASVSELADELERAVVMGASGRVMGGLTGAYLNDPGHLTNRTVQPGQPARDARWFQAEYILMVRRIAAQLAAKNRRLGTIQTNRARRWVR